MKEIQIPIFKDKEFFDTYENTKNRVVTVPNVDISEFNAYIEYFTEKSFVECERYAKNGHSFAALSCESIGVFLNYFESIRELTVVLEQDCKYFSYEDTRGSAAVKAQITQIALEDFGMSYAIRLPDGRFILIDGGREFEPDADKLYDRIKADSPFDTPVVAAWIMSHPHSDHYFCFMPFMEKYADSVKIEKFILNFPEVDDFVHYPKLERYPLDYMPRMYELIEKTGAPLYTAHTGQIYRIGDAVCEMLSSMDNTIHLSSNINAISLVIKMELEGQTILWMTDASTSAAKLPERYASCLKADILQIPHHGFQCGTPEAEIEVYDLIKPKVCFLPAMDYNAYSFFCIHRAGTHHLMWLDCVEEIITGEVERTITLPYVAPTEAKREHESKAILGLESCGAKVWIFSELSTGDPEDLVFTILNTIVVKTDVWIELFFEDQTRVVRFIKAEIPSGSIRRICIVGDEVDGDARFYNPDSLKIKGVPEGVPFVARFMSHTPIVVSNKNHAATYHSNTFGEGIK